MINHQASRLNLLDDYKTSVRNPRRLLPRARARVVRVFQDIPRGDHSDQFRFRFAGFGQKDSGDPTRAAVLYGVDVKKILPTVLSPLEVMDGAITSGNCVSACDKNSTYVHQNNPVIADMLRRHGKDFNFVTTDRKSVV